MILVTGATGHIGNVLVRELVARGEQVRVFVLPGEPLDILQGVGMEVVTGNILDPEALDRAVCGADMVYHLAGMISINTGSDPLVWLVNVQGTRNMIAACRRAGVRRLVYTSSIHAIQHVDKGVLVDECIPFDPNNNMGEYDRSKAEASLAVLEAVRGGLDAVIVCPTGVIGPYDHRLSEVGRMLLNAMRARVQFIINGAYDFVDVRDVVTGMILAAAQGKTGEVYILSGEEISVERIMRLTQKATGKRALSVRVPLWLAEFAARITPVFYKVTGTRPVVTPYSLQVVTGNSTISCAKARRELGYQPRALEQSIIDTVRWLQANHQVWRLKN
jgi:dihydroflavonol-4-reductase